MHRRFTKLNHEKEESGDSLNRYRSWDNLSLLIKLAEKNLPFLNSIFLVVMQQSQVPSWLDDPKVKVVFHEDFIPGRFLPTFNSCTIEMFLSSIPGLSEHFIYVNDDIFFTSMCTPEDFFTDGKLQFKAFRRDGYGRNMFGSQVRSSFKVAQRIAGELTGRDFSREKFMSLEHSAFPMLKSVQEEAWKKCKSILYERITSVRDGKNCNQYVWTYLNMLLGKHADGAPSFEYFAAKDRDITRICRAIRVSHRQVICVNDFGVRDFEHVKKSVNEALQDNLEGKTPEPTHIFLERTQHNAVRTIKSTKIPYQRVTSRPKVKFKQKVTKPVMVSHMIGVHKPLK